MSQENIAFDILWKNVLLIKKELGNIFLFDDILLESEYNQIKSYDLINSDNKAWRYICNQTEEVELHKPYLSKELYGLFFLYRATFGRIFLKYMEGKKNKHITKWNNDGPNVDRLKKCIDNEFLEQIISQEIGGLTLLSDKIMNMIIQNKPKIENQKFHVENNYGIVAGENNGTQTIHSGEKKESWQDNIWFFILISLLIVIIGFSIEHYLFP